MKKINDKHFDIYERAVTYDGEEFQTKTEPLKGNNLPERIEKIGLDIVNHVSNITLEKIKIIRMILNFKIDKRDRIIFLWCSSLRIESGRRNFVPPKINLNMKIGHNDKMSALNKKKSPEQRVREIDNGKIKLRPPDTINIFKYSISGKPIQPKKESICLNCGQKVENYRLYEINFKTIIEGHDNRKRDKQYYNIFNKINMTSSGIEVIPSIEKKTNNDMYNKLKWNKLNNFIIPKIIQELYPKLKFQDYFNLKNDTLFRSKVTCVCDDCYLDITKYCSMAGSNNENLIRTLKKDECLNPLFDIIKQFRPKSVAGINRNKLMTELSKELKNSVNKSRKNKFELSIENSNLIPIFKEKDKRKAKRKLFTYSYNNRNSNLGNKDNFLSAYNINSGFGLNSVFPKLQSINKRNDSNIDNYFSNFRKPKLFTDIYSNDGSYKYEDSKRIFDSNRISKSKNDKLNFKNFMSKNDFTYFN